MISLAAAELCTGCIITDNDISGTQMLICLFFIFNKTVIRQVEKNSE